MMNQPQQKVVFPHPMDSLGRDRSAIQTGQSQQFIAPGIRHEQLPQMYERFPAAFVNSVIAALQGVPIEAFPVGGQ